MAERSQNERVSLEFSLYLTRLQEKIRLATGKKPSKIKLTKMLAEADGNAKLLQKKPSIFDF